MDLSREQIKEIFECVHRFAPGAGLFVFGSRARADSDPGSDLDMLVKWETPLSNLQMSNIKEALSLSNLPFSVDIQDYSQVDANFLESIKADLKSLL